MRDRRPFIQVVRGALEELVDVHQLSFIEAAVLARARDESNWRTGSIIGWTTTGYASEWGIGYRSLRAAIERLAEVGLIECSAARGHAGDLTLLVYDELVRRPDGPGRSCSDAGANEVRSRDSAIGNCGSAGAQPRPRDSDQPERALDIEIEEEEREDLLLARSTPLVTRRSEEVADLMGVLLAEHSPAVIEHALDEVLSSRPGVRFRWTSDLDAALAAHLPGPTAEQQATHRDCDSCNGTRWADDLTEPGEPPRLCSHCDGTGRLLMEAS